MRRLFAVALLLVSACGKSPSSPSQPPASPTPAPVTFADFSGLWTVQYRVTTCMISHNCYGLKGSQRTFDLRLQQSGAEVRGLFVERTFVAEVAGRVSTDGTLVMTGYTPPASSHDGALQITDLTIKRGDSPGLQGTVGYKSSSPVYYEDAQMGIEVTGNIVSATRSDLSTLAASADGAYEGRFVVRTCTPVSRYCYPHDTDEVGSIRLSVRQSGNSLFATLQYVTSTPISLEGTFNGRTVDLAGETTTPSGGGTTLIRITNWRGALDAFGRMSGSFHFDYLYPVSSPTVGGGLECELVQLVKVVP